MRTPEAQLPRLSTAERNQFFRVRGSQIKNHFAARRTQLAEERLVLKRELGRSAATRSLELRAEVPKFMSRQSSHYRGLVDAELAPIANKRVDVQELAAFAQRRFGKDPEALAEVTIRLGIGNESAAPETIGQLYIKAKELGQQLPSSVRESVRTYSREEHFVDDAIETLYSFLKEKNLNLSAANEFWRTWAPVRNQLVSEIRPYNLSGTRTGGFSRRLIQLARGVDPDNAVYAKTVSEGLGIKDLPGNAVRQLVQRLDANQKASVGLRFQQAESTGELDALRFSVNQAATQVGKQQALVSWVLKTIGIGALGGMGFGLARRALPQE